MFGSRSWAESLVSLTILIPIIFCFNIGAVYGEKLTIETNFFRRSNQGMEGHNDDSISNANYNYNFLACM